MSQLRTRASRPATASSSPTKASMSSAQRLKSSHSASTLAFASASRHGPAQAPHPHLSAGWALMPAVLHMALMAAVMCLL